MKKTLALLAVATLLVSASGCGCCRGLFGRSSVGTVGPFYGRLSPGAITSPCCSTCAPTCNTCETCNSCPSCESAPSCGCDSGSQVMYGYNGPMAEMPMVEGAVMGSEPITIPADSVNVGQ